MREAILKRRSAGERLSLGDSFGAGVIRADGSQFVAGFTEDENGFIPMGWMGLDLFDNRGVKKFESNYRNLVVNQGKQDILTVYFADGTQKPSTSWFMGLIVDTGFTGIQATDTSSSHPGWNEFTGYDAATRVVWGQAAPGSGITTITNPTPVNFNITSSGNLKGGFIISNSTKGGTTGVLWAAALFTAPVPVNNGDQMKVTYNLSC